MKRILMFGVMAVVTVMVGMIIVNRVGFLSNLVATASGSKAA